VSQLLDLGKLTQYRFQKINITIAQTSVAGAYQASVQLDRQFNKIVGIAFVEKQGDAVLLDLYDVGAKTERQVWIDPISVLLWTADGNVGPMQKYYSVDIPYASGDSFYAMINTQAVVTNNDFLAQMVLILAKDLTELPR
jgi:hypothetical protein